VDFEPLPIPEARQPGKTAAGFLGGAGNEAAVERPRLQGVGIIKALRHALEAGLVGIKAVGFLSLNGSRPVPGVGWAHELEQDSMEAQDEPDPFRMIRLMQNGLIFPAGSGILEIGMGCCHCLNPRRSTMTVSAGSRRLFSLAGENLFPALVPGNHSYIRMADVAILGRDPSHSKSRFRRKRRKTATG
jgi:hypothetical protein